MKAVVKYGQRDGEVELRDVPEPAIGPRDVLLETRAAGVCGSDIEMWRHHITFPVNTPVIQGHEFCGVVARVGDQVTEFSVGDRVVSETAAYICEKCRFCRTGEYNLCPERLGFGYGTDGAFTRFVKVPERCLHRIPDTVPFEHASLTEPLCVAYNALVVKSRIRPGDTVAILGPGPIGLFAAQVARVCGASRIVVCGTDVDARRFEVALGVGATHVVNVQREDAAERVADLTQGLGADLVVDAAGSSAALKSAMAMVRRNGQITKIGWGPDPLGYSLDPLLSKAVTLQGVYSHTWTTWEAALRLMETGQVDMEAMISHRMTIEDWRQAYEAVESRQACKVVFVSG